MITIFEFNDLQKTNKIVRYFETKGYQILDLKIFMLNDFSTSIPSIRKVFIIVVKSSNELTDEDYKFVQITGDTQIYQKPKSVDDIAQHIMGIMGINPDKKEISPEVIEKAQQIMATIQKETIQKRVHERKPYQFSSATPELPQSFISKNTTTTPTTDGFVSSKIELNNDNNIPVEKDKPKTIKDILNIPTDREEIKEVKTIEELLNIQKEETPVKTINEVLGVQEKEDQEIPQKTIYDILGVSKEQNITNETPVKSVQELFDRDSSNDKEGTVQNGVEIAVKDSVSIPQSVIVETIENNKIVDIDKKKKRRKKVTE